MMVHLSSIQYKVAVMLLSLGCSTAIGKLSIDLDSESYLTNGILKVCPGEHISITCTHNNTAASELTRWVIQGHMFNCNKLVSHISPVQEITCGPLTIIMISDNSNSIVSSTVQTTITRAINGTMVECYAGGLSSSPQVGNVSICVEGKILKTVLCG